MTQETSTQFIRRIPQWRLDYQTSRKVAHGIDLRERCGTDIAAKYFQQVGIPLEIAQRVLLTPQSRKPVSAAWNLPRRYFLPTPLVYACTHGEKVWFKSRGLSERAKHAYHVEARKNSCRKEVVEQGLAMQASHDVAAAAKFLESRDIPFSVIARVLCDRERRRQERL